jgi:tripartite-type tricarboxylate transporter receptor subunit TctC
MCLPEPACTLATRSAALPILPALAWAQAYPERPVHMFVVFATGEPLTFWHA